MAAATAVIDTLGVDGDLCVEVPALGVRASRHESRAIDLDHGELA